jgi:hypothetical protein
MQQPRVTLRISGDLYKELVAVAEARECTLQQALDFYFERVKQQAIKEARQLQLPNTPGPDTKAKLTPVPKPKAQSKPKPPKFECSICKKRFHSWGVADGHMLSKHAGKLLPTELSGRTDSQGWPGERVQP